MQAVVDRIEGDRAVLIVRGTEGDVFEIPLSLLPPIGEGDVLDFIVAKNEEETDAARGRVEGLVGKLKRKRIDREDR
jgi:hypothetical protein